MILTVCLSPCIDVNIEVDSLSVGKSHIILNKRIFYTGKALNVAIGGARLNADMFATGFMYEDNCTQFEHELHREHVNYKFVWSKGRVRENYKFVDHRSMLTEINDVSPEVSAEKQEELITLVKQLSAQSEAVVISGSLAKGMTPDYYAKLLSVVPSGVMRVVDTEGDRLYESLKCGVDLVKPNLEEMERTVKHRIASREDMLSACKTIHEKGAKLVLLSLGKNGAIIYDGEKYYYSKSVNVAMNSTVGAGDAMLAAATLALVRGKSPKEILQHGVAAGTAAVTSPNNISFTKDKYQDILSSLIVEEF